MKNIFQRTFEIPESFVIDKAEEDSNGDTIVFCHTRAKVLECVHCQGKTSGHDTVTNKKRHTIVSGKTVWLQIRKRRVKCKECKRVFVEPIDGISRARLTDHMTQQVQEKARGQDYTRVAKEFGIGIATVSRKVSDLPVSDFKLPKKKNSISE